MPLRVTGSRAPSLEPRVPSPEFVEPPRYNPLMESVRAHSGRQRWEAEVLEPALKKSRERAVPFTTTRLVIRSG